MSDNFLPISILPKTDRLPAVVDLFSGCGGLSYGFKRAGFDILYGADFQKDACDTANSNLCWQWGEDSTHECCDITQLDSERIRPLVNGRDIIVIGGPPCQAYSIAGRGKLRSLGASRAHINDQRGFLFQDFLRIATELDAVAIVMENVPESTNFGSINVPQTVSEILKDYGYDTTWSILNAANYGVPQNRERVILVATKVQEVREKYTFPIPECNTAEYIPVIQRAKSLSACDNYCQAPCPDKKLSSGHRITVREAISDLPLLMENATQKYRLTPMNTLLKYSTGAEYEFQKRMRENNTMNGVTANCFRNNSRDFKTFERMKPGDNYLIACEIAETRLQEACNALDIPMSENNVAYQNLRKKTVPPYEAEKFTDKWRRLDPDKPSPTVLAHMSKDTYAFIHPWEPRGLSVREAARMQSFPDGFQFMGSMGEAFRQIGNAVPPLLAEAIGVSLRRVFEDNEL